MCKGVSFVTKCFVLHLPLPLDFDKHWKKPCPLTICCDLAIVTHGKKMHNKIIMVVKERFLVALVGKFPIKTLQLIIHRIYICIFLPYVAMIKSQWMVVMDKVPSSQATLASMYFGRTLSVVRQACPTFAQFY
jgi:hypothetical protein